MNIKLFHTFFFQVKEKKEKNIWQNFFKMKVANTTIK